MGNAKNIMLKLIAVLKDVLTVKRIMFVPNVCKDTIGCILKNPKNPRQWTYHRVEDCLLKMITIQIALIAITLMVMTLMEMIPKITQTNKKYV